MKRKHKIFEENQKGFSLVEILLAIVILSLIITPILQVFISSMGVSNRSRELLGATEVAQMTLEVLNSKPMDSTPGIQGIRDMLTESGAHTLLPSLDHYTPVNTPYGVTGFSTHASFVSALRSSYGNASEMLCIVSDTTNEKRFSLHNVTHNGYSYDVVVSMTSDAAQPDDKYYTYDVFLEVFEVNDGVHYSERLLIMESAVVNTY